MALLFHTSTTLSMRVYSLAQQEQNMAQSKGGWLSPGCEGSGGGKRGGGGGGRSEAKAVDIIQMLTKARTEYDKVSINAAKLATTRRRCHRTRFFPPSLHDSSMFWPVDLRA